MTSEKLDKTFIMQKKHPRTNRILHRALGVFFIVISITFTGFSQHRKVQYQAEYEGQQTHFGFFIGVGPTSYKTKVNLVFMQNANTKYVSITSPSNYQFRIGGLMNYRLNDYFDFRLMPGISITSRDFMLTDFDSTTVSKNEIVHQYDKAWLEVPAMLKFKSQRRGNIRMYAFAGLRYGYETNALNLVTRVRPESIVKTRRSDFCIEYGIGLDAYLRFFKFSPEVLFSHGIPNMLQPTLVGGDITANKVLDKLSTHSVTFQFVFN